MQEGQAFAYETFRNCRGKFVSMSDFRWIHNSRIKLILLNKKQGLSVNNGVMSLLHSYMRTYVPEAGIKGRDM